MLASILSISATDSRAEPIPVELRQVDGYWQLLRDGEPYLIKGAGGDGPLDRLAAAGADSIRTWDTDNVESLLDEAHRLGMTVTVGIWLEHERFGFDYGNKAQVREQLARARESVMRYRDHPALLLWGVGNEMEEYESGDDPRIWAAVNDVAAMIKELDPHHPTMTVTAEIGGGRIKMVHQQSPAIDIHGINSYGGAASVAQRLREAGATKPYVITEFGPAGPWEVPKTAWGAPFEQTSTQKADFYRHSYRKSVLDNPTMALGAYAFLWGDKMEGTATWFGMLLSDGSRLAALDVMTELWSGKAYADLAPMIEPVTIEVAPEMDPGAEIIATTSVTDPEGEPVLLRWVLRPESGEYATAGDFRPALPDIEGAILEAAGGTARVRMPDAPGGYRLFAYASDPAGNAATANIPLLVKGVAGTRFPVSVYEERFENMPWAPSGIMGNAKSLTIDGGWSESVFEGSNAIRLHYTGRGGRVGVAWQHPPDNWGNRDGGFDLTGASALEFWVRGESGGEKASFGVGLLDKDTDYPDSVIVKTRVIEMASEWNKLRIAFDEQDDLSSLKVAFVVTVEGERKPVTIYLDSIRFVR
ncbi:MAG: glycosyl hydrolase family 2 [Gammaproteobacteria bacterium]|nr:glycosyl hydrolase family 2 [Gammaproteobacteria bacterium]MDH5302690.1 glycosyl hydrolase family 2 [Gammaproteobacteria bacterium]